MISLLLEAELEDDFFFLLSLFFRSSVKTVSQQQQQQGMMKENKMYRLLYSCCWVGVVMQVQQTMCLIVWLDIPKRWKKIERRVGLKFRFERSNTAIVIFYCLLTPQLYFSLFVWVTRVSYFIDCDEKTVNNWKSIHLGNTLLRTPKNNVFFKEIYTINRLIINNVVTKIQLYFFIILTV